MAGEITTAYITIRNATDGDRVPVATPNEPQGTKSGVAMTQQKAEQAKEKGAFVQSIIAVQQVKPYVDQVVGFTVSQIQATTGSAELQQRMQVVSGAVSSIASMGMGAIVGGLPGAAVSAALGALSGTMSAVQNGIAIDINRRIERDNIERKTSRLGESVKRSRTGEIT